MGRARKTLTEDQLRQVEGLASVLTVDQMADYFGMARKTFFRLMERNNEIKTLYKKGRSSVIRDVAKNLIQKAKDGDTVSAIFYLKTQAGWKESDGTDNKDRRAVIVNVSNKNGH